MRGFASLAELLMMI